MMLRRSSFEQHFPHSTRDVENILRIDNLRRISHHFRQRADIGAHHRRPAGHGLQRRQTKAFIKDGKTKAEAA